MRQRGFTLIETMLFISLSAIVTLAIFSVIWNVLEVSETGERFQASQLELLRAGERIDMLIRSADTVESITESSIVLGITDSSDTLEIVLQNGVIEIERNDTAVALTGDKLSISSLQFTDYALPGTSARFITYEIYGDSGVEADNFPIMLRGGGEVRTLIAP